MVSLPAPRITQAGTNFLSGQQLGRQQGFQDQDRQTMMKAGEMASAGDLTGASNALFKGGQFDKGLATKNAIAKMSADRLEQSLQVQDRLARLAGTIETPEQFEMAKTRLKQMGLPVPQSLTFEQLPQIRAEALSVADQMTLALKEKKMQQDALEAQRGKLKPGWQWTPEGTAVRIPGTEESPEPTSGMREYEFAMQQREAQGQPRIPFEEFKQASKAPLVSIGGEKEYDKTRGKSLGEEFGTLQSQGKQAVDRIGQLRQIDELLSNPNVYTGTGAQAINALKRTAQTLFGNDSIEGVADADAARRISTEMALSLRDNLPGPMSDSDREFLIAIPPGIGDTAEGRKLLVELMTAKEQRRIETAQLARQYADQNDGRLDDGWYAELSRYNEQNPVFSPEQMEKARSVASAGQQQSPAAGVLPRVNDVRSYNAVPRGSRYIDPEGRIRTKN